MKLFIFISKVNLGTLPSTQNTFSVLLDSVCAVTAMITKCDKSQNATARIPELSQFVTVAFCDGSKPNFSDRFHSSRAYTPKCRKHVHINIGPFQEGFLGASIMSFITNIHTHKHIYQWNNTKMGKNLIFHIHVKSEPGYSPKYPKHVFNVIGLSLCRHGHDHKMRQITKCDGTDSRIVAMCDCRVLWRFKMQLLRFMSVVQEGILLSAGSMYTSTSDTVNKVSFVNGLWALKLIYLHTNIYTSEITRKWAKMKLFIFMSKVNLGTLPSTQNTFSVLLDSVCAVTAMITKCDKSQNATARIPDLSQFVTVAFCDGSKCNFSDSCP